MDNIFKNIAIENDKGEVIILTYEEVEVMKMMVKDFLRKIYGDED